VAYEDDESVDSLRERLRRLEAAVDATGLGLWEWDVRRDTLTWNTRNRELFGVSADQPIAIQHFTGFVHPEDRELVREAYRSAADKPDGGSFSAEYRTLIEPDGKARWILTRGRVMKDAEGARLVVGSNLDISDRKSAEERRSLLLRELAHRAKNGILIMMTIVAQTARSATGVKDFEEVLTARLQSMADSQDLVTEASGRPLPLVDIIDRALTPFDPGRFDVAPELKAINVPTEVVVAMALLLHELSTNAVKYGALSHAAGRVKLGLTSCGDGKAVLKWTEVDGPPVRRNGRRGFGSRLLEVALRNNGGLVEADFHPDGFRAQVHFPAEATALRG
jgi:PAS domain S-box-containing protein